MNNKAVTLKPSKPKFETPELMSTTINRMTFVLRDELHELTDATNYQSSALHSINHTLKEISERLATIPEPGKLEGC